MLYLMLPCLTCCKMSAFFPNVTKNVMLNLCSNSVLFMFLTNKQNPGTAKQMKSQGQWLNHIVTWHNMHQFKHFASCCTQTWAQQSHNISLVFSTWFQYSSKSLSANIAYLSSDRSLLKSDNTATTSFILLWTSWRPNGSFSSLSEGNTNTSRSATFILSSSSASFLHKSKTMLSLLWPQLILNLPTLQTTS